MRLFGMRQDNSLLNEPRSFGESSGLKVICWVNRKSQLCLRIVATGRGRTHSPLLTLTPAAYLAMPIAYVPVHSQSAEPSALAFPAQVPEPLMPLCCPLALTIFHLLAAGFAISVEADPSYV
jgi:hypothetical protein